MRIWICLFLFVAGCDSPLRHKVDEGGIHSQAAVEVVPFQKYNLRVETKWLMGPFGNVKSPSTLVVYVYEGEQLASLPSGVQMNFYATMPSMGHPLDDIGFFTEVSKGVYINSSILFNMGGDWKMELWLQNSDYEIMDQVSWLEFF